MTKILIELSMSFIGAMGFAFVFNSKHQHLLFLGLGGVVSWASYIVAHLFLESVPLCYFIAAITATLYSEVFARVLKTPTTTVLIPALIPAIPGSMLYYTMLYLIKSDWQKFFTMGTDTLKVAAAIALGIASVSLVIKSIFSFSRRQKYYHS